MARLYSLNEELMAIRGLVSTSAALSGRLLAELDESYFHTEVGRLSYEAIAAHREAHGSPPTFRMLTENRLLPQEVRDTLRDSPAPPRNTNELNTLIEDLRAHRSTRIAYTIFKDGLEMLQQETVQPDALRLFMQEGLSKFHSRTSINEQMLRIGLDDNSHDLIHDIIYGEENDIFVKTGWNYYDSQNGGFPRGGLVIIGGASGSGKSVLTTSLSSYQASIGHKVTVVPLEMSRQDMMIRKLSNIGGIDSLRIMRKQLTEEEKAYLWGKAQRYRRSLERLGAQVNVYHPEGDPHIEEILAGASLTNPDAVYIDYIGLVGGNDGEDQWRQLGKTARYGKIWAGNEDRVCVMAAQVGEDGRLRYSQTVKEHASVAFSFVATKESRELGLINVDMFKARMGRLLSFALKIDYARSTARDPEPHEVPTPAPGKEAGKKKAQTHFNMN